MAKPTIAEYPCTQQELYSIADTVYKNLESNLASFAVYKTKYDAEFIAGLRKTRKTAMELPDVETRNTSSETLRQELIPLGKACTDLFQVLKGYIKDAFAKELLSTKYDAAGQKKYSAATNENWEELSGMNDYMNDFIATNLTLLTTKGYMPGTFATNVSTATEAFAQKYSSFKEARQTSGQTADKIAANNLLYDDLKNICDEGQRVYRNDAAMKKLFVFVTIKDLVSPPGSASLKTIIKKSGENTLIANAKVTIKTADGVAITALSGVDGMAVHDKIDPGTYTCTVEVEGMPAISYQKEVNTGTAARKEVFV